VIGPVSTSPVVLSRDSAVVTGLKRWVFWKYISSETSIVHARSTCPNIVCIHIECYTTGIHGFAESELLSAQAGIHSKQPVPRGNSRQSPLGTAGPTKGSLSRAKVNTLVTDVPRAPYGSRQRRFSKTKKDTGATTDPTCWPTPRWLTAGDATTAATAARRPHHRPQTPPPASPPPTPATTGACLLTVNFRVLVIHWFRLRFATNPPLGILMM
jgi:hypothetical protein